MAKIHSIDILNAFKVEPAPLDFVIPNLLAGTVGALVSAGGAGKSMLALQIASQIAGGANLLDFPDLTLGKVVYLPAEDHPDAIKHRLHALGAHLNSMQREMVAANLKIYPLVGHNVNILDEGWFSRFCSFCTDTRLIIIDTLRRFHPYEENSSVAMSEVISKLEELATKLNTTILFLHHANKSSFSSKSSDAQQSSRGSSVLVDNVRFQAYLCPMSQEEAEQYWVDDNMKSNFVRFGVSKANYGKILDERWYRRHEGGILKPAVLERKSTPKPQKVRNETL